MSIKLHQVTKQYSTQKAVNDISFEVSKGQIVGFLGPNGAGKSTTMKMITGFIQPDHGSIEVCGIKVEGEALFTKKKIGYLPEHNPLYLEMYVKEYLSMLASLHVIPDSKKRIEEVIRLTGLSTESNKEISQLSKGYRQRVGLAGAIIHDPEVLILDEPTTGLDPNQILEIRSLIKELGKHKTILFSSHILQEVEAICDRVIIIHKGTIVADRLITDLKMIQASGLTRVKFSGEVAQKDLMSLSGIQEVKCDEHGEWLLRSNLSVDINKELMSFALQHNLNIVSLQAQTLQLEDIFRQLTGE
ncbi:MAG: gliding motility-associated ABC transporter ATP-binding subunit GldA [Chitinophagaceae bacterium]